MFMGDSFEIRGISYGGRLGPTLSVGPNKSDISDHDYIPFAVIYSPISWPCNSTSVNIK